MPKYTFLLPAFKGKFLYDAIESILNQTYKDFRLIVSDDCSPEDLKSIVSKFDDPRIIYRKNKENMGSKSLVSHWNLLVNLCNTEWLIMATDDDLYDKDFLTDIDKLQCDQPNISLLRARTCFIDKDGDVVSNSMPSDYFYSQQDFITTFYRDSHRRGIGNYVFRTNKLKQINGFIDYPLAWWSDVMTCFLMAENGVLTTPDIKFSFRQSGINISSQKDDNVSSRKKLNATLAYDRDLNILLQKFDFNKTKLQTVQYKDFCFHHKKEFVEELCYTNYVLSFKELLSTYRKYKTYFMFKYNCYQYFKFWFITKIK